MLYKEFVIFLDRRSSYDSTIETNQIGVGIILQRGDYLFNSAISEDNLYFTTNDYQWILQNRQQPPEHNEQTLISFGLLFS